MTSSRCPLCQSNQSESITGKIKRCLDCGAAFNTNHRKLQYSDKYFIEDYKKQYGKTYADDYDNIYQLSKKRIANILKLIGKKPVFSILDLGSALGFFLKCSVDSGFSRAAGVEISKYASQYCREKFDIPVTSKPFEEVCFKEKFDVITAWFFIEHLKFPLEGLRRIFDMLEPGGVFAMSAPSIFGPQFYFKRNEWISTHPQDHRIDLSPSSARRIFKSLGFRKVVILGGGFHPERVLSVDSVFFPVFKVLYRKFSKLTAFSDTIEIYAVK